QTDALVGVVLLQHGDVGRGVVHQPEVLLLSDRDRLTDSLAELVARQGGVVLLLDFAGELLELGIDVPVLVGSGDGDDGDADTVPGGGRVGPDPDGGDHDGDECDQAAAGGEL